MSDIAINLDPAAYGTPHYGDILMVDGTAVQTNDVDARGTDIVRQRLYTRLRLLTNEWFLDLSDGVPYFPQLLTTNPSISRFEAVLQNVILATPGVTGLLSWQSSVNRAARSFSVSFKVTSSSGDVTLTVDLSNSGGFAST